MLGGGDVTAELNGQFSKVTHQRLMARYRSDYQRKMPYDRSEVLNVPNNYELSALSGGFDPFSETTLKNYKARNIGDL